LIKLIFIALVTQNTIAKPLIDLDIDSIELTTPAPKEVSSECSIKERVYYKISNVNGGNLASNPESTSELIVTNEIDSDSEKWLLVKVQTDIGTSHVIINKRTKTALTFNQETFQLQSPVRNSNQIFVVIPKPDSPCSYFIVNYQKIDGTGYEYPTSIKILSTNEAENVALGNLQKLNSGYSTWKFVEYPCDPIPNQPYSIVHVESGLPAGIIAYYSEGEYKNQMLLRSGIQAARSEPWNQFEFVQTNGSVKIYNKHGNLGIYANVEDSSSDIPTVFGDHDKGDLFKIEQTIEGYCVISESDSDQALEGTRINDKYQEASPILLKTKNGLSNQQWKLEPYGQPIVDQYVPYYIKNRATGKVMEFGDDRRKVSMNEFDQKKINQVFYFDIPAESFGYFYMRGESGLVLDAEYSQLYQYRQENAAWNRMKLVLVETSPEGKKYFKIVPESQPGKCLIAKSDDKIFVAKLEDNDHFGHWEIILLATEPIKDSESVEEEAKEY